MTADRLTDHSCAGADAFVPDLVVLGLILAGGFYFIYLLIADREVLEP